MVFLSMTKFLVPVIFMGLHVFVGVIQAYIFMLLTMVYVADVLPHEQGELAATHLQHDQPGRGGPCVVPGEVYRSFPRREGNGDAVHSGAGG